ncbi:hypothetical protein H1Z61_08235 [Bacillus aquiflavi]|uniref:Uncharacterized protein n=1 Tax=Bacillus aquiflavi TaxID=2672567 RepID=A0A6B3VZP1_9BACI|nr:hypothetical protein [Bacillus aquiflavi]MBA4537133.1 hypothetical protein [Bacillus aquiflavi]NEY82718.1 hypothetical protein [Bacillus aquiflavi]UAC49761.1 hypothetical protein K6959_08200 [Bacillus aquiflavi]
MKELIKFSLHDYIRSHKYFPPVSTYLILVSVFYTYKPNPVVDSYAVTALMLYVISSWLCISFLSLDHPVQKQLMILNLKSRARYYVSKLISVWFISVILTIYAFLYPIVFNMFNEPVSMSAGFVSLANHLVLATLGISVASLFSKTLMRSAISSYGGLVLISTISLAALGIYKILPSAIKNIVWLLPPATITQSQLVNWNGKNISELSLFPFVWVSIYSLLIIFLFLKLTKRSRKNDLV